MLVALAAGIVGSRDEAEDIVQDVLLKLWTICPELSVPFDSLASVVTRNMACTALRRRHPASDISDIEISSEDEDTAESQAFDHIMRCIDALPAFQQLIVRLRHIEGMDYTAMSRVTGSSEVALRKAVSRARIAIRDQYLKEERNER